MYLVRKGVEYTVAEGHDWFWKMFEDGTWEPETFKIFDKCLDPEKTFVDIGAWIGPTTLYAAPRSKQVFAFEPDPVAYRSLTQNLEFNKAENVVPYPVAVSNKWQGLNFGAKTQLGDSMSSEIWAKEGGMQVPAVSLEAIVVDLQPSFIKIDIEGGEKFLFENSILALSQWKPTIHLSLHTPSFADDVDDFKKKVMLGLAMYPFVYDQDLNRIELKDAFDVNAFNSIVLSFTEIV